MKKGSVMSRYYFFFKKNDLELRQRGKMLKKNNRNIRSSNFTYPVIFAKRKNLVLLTHLKNVRQNR